MTQSLAKTIEDVAKEQRLGLSEILKLNEIFLERSHSPTYVDDAIRTYLLRKPRLYKAFEEILRRVLLAETAGEAA